MLHIITYILINLVGGGGGYTIGLARVNNPAINDKLTEYGLLEIKTVLLNGGSGYAFLNKVFIGGSGYGGNIKKTGDSIQVKYGLGGGYFEIGYMPYTLKFITPFLSMGIGGYAEEITIANPIRRSDWNGIWQNFRNETHLTRGSFSLSPSAGIILFFKKIPLSLMLTASYNTIFSKTWKFEDETTLGENPDTPLGGFSFKISLLTGGFKYGK